MGAIRPICISNLSRAIPQTHQTCQPLQRRCSATLHPEQRHHDLASFLAHAARTNLSPTSTTYIGTHYEYTVQRALARLGLALARTGGRLDRGIDLLGAWRPPSLPPPPAEPLRVLVQCKALSRKAGPNLIRELEGAFAGAPAGWRALMARGGLRQDSEGGDAGAAVGSGGVMALLVAPKEATKGVRDAMGRSRWPMGYAKVALDGRVEQVLWNRSAAFRGLEGLGVSTRFRPSTRVAEDSKGAEASDGLEKEVILTWEGEIWEGDKHVDAAVVSGDLNSAAADTRTISEGVV